MSSNIKYFLISLLGGIVLGFALFIFTKERSDQNYVAIFFNNGNVYFGRLSTFPRLKLTEAAFVQVDSEGKLSLQRFADAFWLPQGPIYLNKDAILFIAPIKNESPVITFLKSKSQPLPTQSKPFYPEERPFIPSPQR